MQLAKWPYYDHKLFHQPVYDWVCNEAAACKSRLEKGGYLSSGDCLSHDYVKGSIAGTLQDVWFASFPDRTTESIEQQHKLLNDGGKDVNGRPLAAMLHFPSKFASIALGPLSADLLHYEDVPHLAEHSVLQLYIAIELIRYIKHRRFLRGVPDPGMLLAENHVCCLACQICCSFLTFQR